MKLLGRFLLPDTLRGGQAFRWRPDGDAWIGTIGRHAARIQGHDDHIEAVTTNAAANVRRYFRLDDDYDAQLARLAHDAPLAPAVQRYRGLRLLRQDPWETVASFIVSANNNVARIESILQRIAQEAGDPLDNPWGTGHAFPSAARVAELGEANLRALGCGYRAPLLAQTANVLAHRNLARLRALPRAAARDKLLELPGVGPKVADCALIFSLDHTDAFPIDRHVERAIAVLYPRAPRNHDDIANWARQRWGADAALAQQFLFHAQRMRNRA